ncbi:signal peptide-containing protein [Ophiocordyceps camponoti-floridani]|uniref:Signal peptide-containing protein n=1 Tax=Ophiocordyceps camponoti-floridani TaxID=2030778 RepID=A0A8H4VG97_9HYPO|nr:signal peptide-containing protein [Ophiocordyceps camponoti-floridani]
MSFCVALQSAVFYFVACTPCAKVRHRHKAKDQARKQREDKSRLETDQPGLYRHPSPFNTNPYWQEEINMGPSLPKKTASKNSSQRGLASSGRESTVPSMSEHNQAADSPSVSPEDDTVSEDWNRRRGYQREDEELWGQLAAPQQSHKLKDAFSRARGSAGRLIDATLGIDKEVTPQDRDDFYFSPRNPPVNDYHPPVVSSKPLHRDARRWMLQPPPPAKVMEGKVPVSRAVSSGSKSSGRTLAVEEPPLGRAMHERLAQHRLRIKSAPNNPTESELIESLFAPSWKSNHNLPTRSRSLELDGSDDSADDMFARRRKSRRPYRPAPPTADSEDDSDQAGLRTMTEAASHSTSGSSRAARRPKLETIPSSGGGSYRSSYRSKRPKIRRSKTASWANSPVGDDTE